MVNSVVFFIIDVEQKKDVIITVLKIRLNFLVNSVALFIIVYHVLMLMTAQFSRQNGTFGAF